MPPGPTSPRRPVLTEAERDELERWQRSTTAPAGIVRRARIILLAAAGMPLRIIAPTVGVERRTVRDWLDRFRTDRLAGLQDRPRAGRPRTFSPVTAEVASWRVAELFPPRFEVRQIGGAVQVESAHLGLARPGRAQNHPLLLPGDGRDGGQLLVDRGFAAVTGGGGSPRRSHPPASRRHRSVCVP